MVVAEEAAAANSDLDVDLEKTDAISQQSKTCLKLDF